MERNTIKIQNLKCGGCANTIIKNIEKIDGVSEVSINHDDSIVILTSENKETLALVNKKLKSLGYPAIDDDNSIIIKAKSFVSCATGKINK